MKKLPYFVLLFLGSCHYEDSVEEQWIKEPIYLFRLIDKSTGEDFFEAYDSVYSTDNYTFYPEYFTAGSLFTYGDTLNVLILRQFNNSFTWFEVLLGNKDIYRINMKIKGDLLAPQRFSLIYNGGEDSTVLDFINNPELFSQIQDRNAFVYGEKPNDPPVIFPIYLEKK